jgi:hypothetical protein
MVPLVAQPVLDTLHKWVERVVSAPMLTLRDYADPYRAMRGKL